MSRLGAINNWIERARESKYDSVKLAENCRISPSQLRRFFLEHFFRPPQEWLDELRLWDALSILQQGESIKCTAAQLDFADGSHLSHRFKEYFGCSPKRLLRDVRSQLPPERSLNRAEHCLISPLYRHNARYRHEMLVLDISFHSPDLGGSQYSRSP